MRRRTKCARKGAGVFALAIAIAFLTDRANAQGEPPGPIKLTVDATQVSQRILHAKLVYTVRSGPLTLYYPKWMPADHSPDGPIWNVAGLKFFPVHRRFPGNKIWWICTPSILMFLPE